MIHVTKDQLQTVEYLIHQSRQGNHVLFDHALVKKVFTTPSQPMTEEESYEVEHHIEKLIALETLTQQKIYLDRLESNTLFRVIKTYFNIVENNLYETKPLMH